MLIKVGSTLYRNEHCAHDMIHTIISESWMESITRPRDRVEVGGGHSSS